MSPSLRYINGDDLSEIIKSDKKPNQDYIVIDVRDDDWVGGNIKHSLNVPSEQFRHQVIDLVDTTKEVPMVIFHCALSQARGPKAARLYAEARNNLQQQAKDKMHDSEVLILRGGFTEFQTRFRHDSELVENWDKKIWDSPYH